MVPRYDRLADLWRIIKPLFDKMLNMDGLSKREHASICNFVYGYCISVDSAVTVGENSKVIGYELYKKLRAFFRHHVQSLRSKAERLSGSDLLTFFEKFWTQYSLASKYIDHRCHYLNRNWVKTKVDEGQKDVVIVYSLALMIWRDELFKPCSRALMSAVLGEIERERKGETIAATRLCTIIGSLVELSLTSETHASPSTASHNLPSSTQSQPQTARQNPAQIYSYLSNDSHPDWRLGLPVYRDHFEQQFLLETMHFYELESIEYLRSYSVTDYLKWAEARVEEERVRARTYLHSSTLNELVKTAEESMIGNHIETITAEFTNLLKENRIEDLSRMYRALVRFEEGEARLVQMMEAFVDEVGSTALREVSHVAKTNPKVFVDTIINVQQKSRQLLIYAFSRNASFGRAIDKGCERFINRNAITESAGSSRKTPELLAKYSDLLLRKSTKDSQPDDLEKTLSCVMDVFKYVEDKDVFQKFYSNMLARRLVQNQSISEDAEAQMISLLKNTCGVEYTSKLQRMFQDISSSRDLNQRFSNWITEKQDASRVLYGVDFSIMVLSSNAWPFQGPGPMNLPLELEGCLKVFCDFYQSCHEGRKLTWCYNLSRGEVIGHYSQMRHTFQVSTYQMAILMLYNSSTTYKLSQLQSLTNLEPNSLNQVIQIFLRSQILQLASGDEQSKQATDEAALLTLTPESEIVYNPNYSNKRVRVNLNLPMKSETKQEAETTLSNVECDRKLGIQACIVRIMKTRKKMDHQQLVKEVIDQMSSRFTPAVQQIKMCINSLIERDFIKRDDENLSSYEYVA